MIISSSAVSMSASSTKKVTYKETQQTLMSNVATGEKRYSESSFTTTYERTLTGNSLGGDTIMNNMPQSLTPVYNAKERTSIQDLLRQIRAFLMEFRNRLSLMIGKRDGSIAQNIFSGGYQGEVLDLSQGTGNVNVWNVINYSSSTYNEEECMTFQTVGKVLTADGRSIDFNMQVEMSREFEQTTESLTKGTAVIMTDPLVISLDSNPVLVSDQKWKFDIDGNGEADSISLLSKGLGFLAFDKNEDGIINNGLELFGAKTGNGFAELMQYDEDKNGWIDENDAIYSKLQVWLKDDLGNDKLISLKDANVGAIYLANQRTEFSVMSEDGREQNAQIRRTGVYLSEDGCARSIQQLDMVSGG